MSEKPEVTLLQALTGVSRTTGASLEKFIGQISTQYADLARHIGGETRTEAEVLTELRDLVFGPGGMLDTFSQGGPVDEVAARHAAHIKGLRPRSMILQELAPRLASNFSLGVQGQCPELATKMSELMRR